jgi:hypothetical protein
VTFLAVVLHMSWLLCFYSRWFVRWIGFLQWWFCCGFGVCVEALGFWCFGVGIPRGGGKGGTGGGYGPPYLFELFLYSTSNIFIDDD